MTRRENYLNGRLDRDRDKAQASARFGALDRLAENAVAIPFEQREEVLTFLRLVVGHAFKRLCAMDCRHETRAFFGRLASDDDFRGLALSMRKADRLFVEPANDTGGEG